MSCLSILYKSRCCFLCKLSSIECLLYLSTLALKSSCFLYWSCRRSWNRFMLNQTERLRIYGKIICKIQRKIYNIGLKPVTIECIQTFFLGALLDIIQCDTEISFKSLLYLETENKNKNKGTPKCRITWHYMNSFGTLPNKKG